MAKRCPITGKGVLAGNTVSHANNRKRCRFMPNLQPVSLMSEKLGQMFHLRLSARGLRTIEHNGGLDAYLLNTPNSRLTDEAKKIKQKLVKATSKA